MRKTALFLVALLLLTGCGNGSGSDSTPETLSVPSYCAKTKILAAFPTKVPDPKFINTDWEPAEGTDLYEAYNAGGIACSYGIQEAEIGATILWAPDNKTLFDQLTPNWQNAGQKEIDLPDLDEEKAFVLTEGKEGAGEFHVWTINLLIDGVWIQVGATFLSSIEEAMPLVKAAVNSLRTAKQAADTSLIGCYLAQSEKDMQVFKIEYHDNNTVSGNLYYNDFKNIPAKGLFLGTYTNGVLEGIYSIETVDGTLDEKVSFEGNKKGFTQISKSAKPDAKDFVPAEDCETLLNQ